MLISCFPFKEATAETLNSGKEVPIATIVSPMTSWLMPIYLAKTIADLTSKCAPKTNKNVAIDNSRKVFTLELEIVFDSGPGSTCFAFFIQ